MFEATFAVTKPVFESLDGKVLRRLASSSLNKTLPNLQRDLGKQIRKTYAYQGQFVRDFRQLKSTPATLNAQLIVDYRPIGLHQYPTRYAGVGNPVQVKVLKARGWSEVQGRQGFGAWKMKRDSRLYMRRQHATWAGHRIRAPYKPLYAPAVAQMVNNPAVYEKPLTWGWFNVREYIGRNYNA